MKEKINKLINEMVLEGCLPAAFFDAEVREIKDRKFQNKKFRIYSKKYKQNIILDYPFSPISKIQ